MTIRPRHLARPDAALRGHEAGSGPTVLLLHAGGERRGVWTPVIEVLVERGFRCVAYDQRGHGGSDGELRSLAPSADDVAAMIAAEPPDCVVVGASLGGFAAIAALADPVVQERVSGLVLVDTVPDIDPARVRRFLATLPGVDGRAAIVDDILGRLPQLSRIAGTLALPVLLVRGGDTSPILDADVDRLHQLIPHATVTRILQAGHLVARDRPRALAEAIAGTIEWPALALLHELGADRLDHPGGNLLDHLRRVRDLVADAGGRPALRLATLCHAMYGTDGFPHPMLPLERRDRLRAAIGDEAEAAVYRYDACARIPTYAGLGADPLPLVDRFTGETIALTGTGLADFATLTIANELDVARHATLPAEARSGIHTLITALATYAPDIAATALADPVWH